MKHKGESILFPERQLSQNSFDSPLNRDLLKKERICSFESKCFPFRVDFFQKVLGVQESKQDAIKLASVANGDGKSAKCVLSP